MSVFSFSALYAILLFCISLPIVSTAKFLGNETDKLALLAFKSQTQDPFKVMSSWNDSNHFCEWEGVKCSPRHERVTALTLRGKGLMGILSPHTGNLSFLRTLVLENNSFQGEIPPEFGKLFRLEYLVLSNNSLVGEIPANISLCSNLKSLFLSSNHLAGKIPIELGSLSKLVNLTFEVNKLEGSIPPSLGNLTSLKILHLSRNNLVGSIPSTLDQLKSIMNLALESNNLTGKIPPSFYNLSTLVTFSVEDNQLTGNLPDDIGLNLPNLERFLVGMNKFSGPIPSSLFNVSGLSVVDVGINQFSGKVPLNIGNLKSLRLLAMGDNNLVSRKPGDLDFLSSLTNCSNLQAFSIAINQFGGTLPASIANFSKQLTKMYIGENLISGNIPNEIGNIRSLFDLDLSSNLFTGSIPTSVGDLQNLEELDLNSNQLSGRIPSSLRNLPRLFHLDLHNNSIEGDIALSLGNQMQILDLSYNNFSGTIPQPKISLSLQLLYLNLGHNSLSGSIPLEVGNLKNLGYLDVSENKMSAEIPVTLGSCDSLEYLFLQHNFLQGALPSSLGLLKGLQVLDVSSNNITGKIPEELEKLLVLRSLNLSFNNLEGEVPTNGVFENASAISIVGTNNKVCGGIPELKLPKCKIQKSKKHGISFALKISLGVLTSSFTVALFLIFYYLRKKPKAKGATEQFLVDLRRVTYNDLHKATDGFSLENLIGMGSYGYVYKGILQPDEGPIAVKVLNLTEHKASKGFLAECEALRVIRHRNLLKILTVCSSVDYRGNDFKALVFEFMQNGSLESWLHPSSNGQDLPRSLNLNQRLFLAIDVACALDYLHNHCEESIVHCDLKSSNVLLADDMTARVCDFGLAKFISKSNSTSTNNDSKSIGIRGTIGYIPPEYGMGVAVSTQGDVYSYGVLLLEMFTGKRPTDDMFNDGLSLHLFCKMALPDRVLDIMDTRLLSEEAHEEDANSSNRMKECLSSVLRIGVACSEELMSDRMDIQDVLREMHSIKDVFLSGLR